MEDLQSLVGGTVVVLGLHALVVVLEGCVENKGGQIKWASPCLL